MSAVPSQLQPDYDMTIPVIAIVDAGKTNKKLLLFDESYQVVFQTSAVLPETKDYDGLPCEDIEALIHFVSTTLEEVFNDSRFDIRAINFSGYGASFVLIGADGNPVCPLYNYLKPYPPELLDKFYESYGGKEKFSLITASPVLGSLNSGMQLYRLRHESPHLFQMVKFALHLPQFLSYLVTGKPFSELTSIGCHTNLWDFTANNYHEWIKAEGIDAVFPPIVSSRTITELVYRGKSIVAGVGLHDSSSALIPYLREFTEPFILISTGTWSISLNPFNSDPLTDFELGQDCLCYISFEGNPVKASRFFIGPEYDKQIQRISAFFNRPLVEFEDIVFDYELARILMTNSDESVPFGDRDLSEFGSFITAYYEMVLELTMRQVKSTRLTLGTRPVSKVYVDGGFSHNKVFMNYLALLLPDLEVYSAAMAQGTSLGCALAIHKNWNTIPEPTGFVTLERYNSVSVAP
jgi:sugar (pentulose or hexulose) kinase